MGQKGSKTSFSYHKADTESSADSTELTSKTNQQPATPTSQKAKEQKTWFERNYYWLLLLKLAPSLTLVGAFGGRPIRIGKLAAPSTVASFDAFLNYILGPMLILALVDTLHIGLNIFEEKWKIREYEKRKEEYEKEDKSIDENPLKEEILAAYEKIKGRPLSSEKDLTEHIKKNIITQSLTNLILDKKQTVNDFVNILVKKVYNTDPLAWEIKSLRDKMNAAKIPEGTNEANFFKETILDKTFRKSLETHGLHEDVFINMLLRKNSYEYGPDDFLVNTDKPENSKTIAKIMAPILTLTEHNYQTLWLQAQISLIRALYERYKQHAPKDDKQLIAFIQINLFSTKLHKQLRCMEIDEDKFTKQVLNSTTPEQATSKLYKNDKKSDFLYAQEWLKTEIRCIRMQENPSLPAYLVKLLGEAGAGPNRFLQAVTKKQQHTHYYEYSPKKIAERFHCTTTDKIFAKEHPHVAKGIRFFDHIKRLFIFPFRMLSLMLALEKLLPYTLPLQYSIPIYVSVGLCLSALIIYLEQGSDDYQDKLEVTRTKQLNALHEREQASEVNRLFLRAEHWEDQQAIATLKQQKAELERQKSDQENQLETMKRSTSALFMSTPASTAHMVAVQEREGSPAFGSPPTPMPMSAQIERKKNSYQVGGGM